MSFWEIIRQLAVGFGTSLLIFGVTLVASLPLGLVIAFGSMSKLPPIKCITKTFVWVIRGTPLMLQIMLIFYAPGLLFEAKALPRLVAVFIAFIINYSCYFSEIYRGGIESISKGQYEAGQVLGMTKTQIFFKVILFQVVKRIVPPMSNEIITLVKDTSLARIIAVPEIIMVAENIVRTKLVIWALVYAGLFYLIFSALLTLLLNHVEKKLNYYSG